MAERHGSGLRRIGMRQTRLGILVALALLLAGCGDDGVTGAGSDAPTASEPAVLCTQEAAPARATLDLDGDGTAEEVRYTAAPSGGQCRAALLADVAGDELSADLDSELPIASQDLTAIQVPGRTGELLLVTARHPRGGFQARLFGYADGKLEELTVDGEPIFDFIATDVLSTPMAATCVDGGFRIAEGRRHEPVGIIAAWDIYRTTYAIDGNSVTMGPTTEVADNVLDEQLQRRYADLVGYELFENCRAGR